jgi:hypothetical protein
LPETATDTVGTDIRTMLDVLTAWVLKDACQPNIRMWRRQSPAAWQNPDPPTTPPTQMGGIHPPLQITTGATSTFLCCPCRISVDLHPPPNHITSSGPKTEPDRTKNRPLTVECLQGGCRPGHAPSLRGHRLSGAARPFSTWHFGRLIILGSWWGASQRHSGFPATSTSPPSWTRDTVPVKAWSSPTGRSGEGLNILWFCPCASSAATGGQMTFGHGR